MNAPAQLVRVLLPPRSLGNASARNVAIAHSRSPWIALLDDDDEWLPKKLEVQAQTAAASQVKMPIIACRLIVRTGTVDLIWPRRTPCAGERLCDYMCRRSLPLAGEGLVQSSMILAPRVLFDRVRFTDGLRQHVDSDWVLRAAPAGAKVVFPESREPLVVWHIETGRPRVSTGTNWRDSLRWGHLQRKDGLFTREAFAGFVCKNVSALAAASGQRGNFGELWREARRFGRPSRVDLVSHLMNYTLTPHVRNDLWRALNKLHRRGSESQVPAAQP